MSVESHYRPCKSCIEGKHDCAEEDLCWCNLCWIITPTRTATPAKQERGYKTKPNIFPMSVDVGSAVMPIAQNWAHAHNTKHEDHIIHEWDGIPGYCETCGETPFGIGGGSSEAVTYGPYNGESEH